MTGLGTTLDPRELVPGDPLGAEADAAAVRAHGEALNMAGEGLRRIDTDAWIGEAGDAFRDEFSYEPRRWFTGADAWLAAAKALEDFAGTLRWAQAEAAEAIALWQRADELAASTAANPSPVTAAWGAPMPPPVGPPDPTKELRVQATHVLANAREQLQSVGDQADRVIREAGDQAPQKSRWGNFFDFLADGAAFVGGVGVGLWDGLAGTAEFLWELSPHHLMDDPGHYGELWDGLVDAATYAWDDPIAFGKAMVNWDLWATDPGRAFGNALFGFIPIVGVLAKVKTLRRLDAAVPDRSPARGLPEDFLPSEWARGGDIPTTGPAARLFPDDYKRYGDLTEREFFEKYWDPTARDGEGSWRYPENGGFAGPPRPNTVEPGHIIDRFGAPTGDYASPLGAGFEGRAIPPSSVGAEYTRWQVLKPLPDSVTEGPAAPWFEQPGGGIQYKFDKPIQWYEDNGYLRRLP